jgi:hypothetical protein
MVPITSRSRKTVESRRHNADTIRVISVLSAKFP